MEQLTIKHLAPYLPYGLEMKFMPNLKPCILSSENINRAIKNQYKPLLIPLSELKNIDNYTLIQFIKKETGLQIDHELDIEVDIDKQQSVWMPIQKVVEAYNILLQYHFDVFDLIGKGLALNKLEYVK